MNMPHATGNEQFSNCMALAQSVAIRFLELEHLITYTTTFNN